MSEENKPETTDATVSSGKTTEELEEIAKVLQAQVTHHSQMATKAQGGLEVVLLMLNPEASAPEGSEEVITEE